jgi:hypothetical protein
MDFLFEFFDIHVNEKRTLTCHDYHGFKWKNINIYPILIVFFVMLCSFWFIGLLLHPVIKPYAIISPS